MKQDMKSIDERLESAPQRAAARLVQGLPDEHVSIVWRSNLNEALRSHAVGVKRRRRILWFARPALGLCAAGSLAVLVWITPVNRPKQQASATPGPSLEASLVRFRQDYQGALDIAGTGLDPNEVIPGDPQVGSNAPGGNSGDDAEADLEL